MIPADIVEIMEAERPASARTPDESPIVEQNLERLAIPLNSEPAEFFRKYCLTAILSKKGTELIDLISPIPGIWNATCFARDNWQMPPDAICLTSGEGEGFIFYSTRDSKVYDLGVEQIQDYKADRVSARWESFYTLMRWYLS